MSNSSTNLPLRQRLANISSLVPAERLLPFLLVAVPVLYTITLAQDLVLGDPTEYTFVANILGIAHPPGYVFMTLLGKLFQSVLPLGDIPWRTHLLAATAATVSAILVYGVVQMVAWRHSTFNKSWAAASALFAGLVVGTGADIWQHGIHANPHIVTAAFLSVNVYLLTRWQATAAETGGQRWLLLFAFSAGLGLTHHPLTVFSWPAYGLFILVVQPGIWRQGRTLLKMAALGALGLSLWLYYPLRSSMNPPFGPADMDTLDGFLRHVLGRGITESLPFFGFGDQLDRAAVFWSLLRLQYALPTIFLALFGLAWLLRGTGSRQRQAGTGATNSGMRPLALLLGLALLSNYAFVINLRQQDIMAYLLGTFVLVGLLAGIGLTGLLDLSRRRLQLGRPLLTLLLGGLFLLGPLLQVARNMPSISLREYDAGRDYLETVHAWFEDQGEGAVLLNDWEHMTPLWYARFVEDRLPDPDDVTAHLVSTDRPWLESVFYFLPAQPVYLSGYRSEIAGAGFRLRPRGPFYQVVQPGDTSLPAELTPIEPAAGGDLEVLAYDLPATTLAAGDLVPLTLAMRAPQGTEDFYVPVVTLAGGQRQLSLEFTTDGHLITPQWQPEEVIIERFEFALPHDLEGGTYNVRVGLRNLSAAADTALDLSLPQLTVKPATGRPFTGALLANFRQRVGLAGAVARIGLNQRRNAPWDQPLVANPGDTVHLTLDWRSLALAEESYTVFVHLIDQANRPLVTLDYTPLGGATPTHLWIPKWLPGQQLQDPYQLPIPADFTPGSYLLEVGLYEMTSGRRLHIADQAGNLVGDRFILGPLIVEP
ncbi:MAG: DUF2723 domain-containing protein [Candidatus Promineifilaceae bacterium]|nr:DUF2723 domain-containing protein [Candidatus Promineifilaceae bacterium]